MLQVSDAYKELIKSNIRPKCEPIIKVSGTDNTGKEIELVWNAKNIKDLKYKRSIDPVGRELPYMELTWTEIYTGKLNAENYPEKYNNIAKYMSVELSFVQDLGFYNTWKMLVKSGTTWRELISKTWKQVKKQVPQETINMPKMFLSARPTISGQTITWVAKDCLSFMNEAVCIDYEGSQDVRLQNVLSNLVLNSRGGFLNSSGLFDVYTNVANNLLLQSEVTETINKNIICDGQTKNILLNLIGIYNYYMDFKNEVFYVKKFSPQNVDFTFDAKTLYDFPKIERSPNISTYLFKHRVVEEDRNRAYMAKPYRQTMEFASGWRVYEYLFEDYAWAYDNSEGTSRANTGLLKRAYEATTIADAELYVVPIKHTSYDNIININNIGEPFNEDNPINPYGLSEATAITRKDFLVEYFSNSSSISFDGLPALNVETGDIVEVETNLFDNNGKRIKKNAMVVYIEINYNGSVKQSIKAHEVTL
jgi:hypothetical protein